MIEGGELVATVVVDDGSIAAGVRDVGDLGAVGVDVVGWVARCFFGDDGVDGCDGSVLRAYG